MLNLEKESFIGNIVLKRSFQMALMSVKNLVYNKLARQNIFVALLIQFRFLLFWLTVINILILILITIAFIALLLLLYFIAIIVIIIIALSIINFIYFILFHFISSSTCHHDFCHILSLVYSHWLYMSTITFLLSLSFVSLLLSSQSFFFFFNTTCLWGRIHMNSSSMVYTYPLITLGKP